MVSLIVHINMSIHILYNICLVLSVFFIMSPGRMASNFPLQNCAIGEIDILELFLSVEYSPIFRHNFLCNVFGCHDSMISQDTSKSHDQNSTQEKTEPRIRYAKVFDRIDYHNHDVNVSSWGFQSLEAEPYLQEIDYNLSMALPVRTIPEVTDVKMKFVQRLFSEMPGVRENATHIAIIFVVKTDFSHDEIKNISSIIQKQNTNIKIFVVVTSEPNQKIIFLKDLLLVPFISTDYVTNVLTMAICKQCSPGWFPFEHDNSMQFFSCYKLLDNPCIEGDLHLCSDGNGEDLAAIETLDELQFLETKLYSETKKSLFFTNDYSNFSAYIEIGLSRDSNSVARRFRWTDNKSFQSRPLVINHWLPGKPSGGYNNKFGLWQFTEIWNDDNNKSAILQNLSRYKDEGWVDVPSGCKLPIFTLCEIVLPRRSDDKYTIRINPANTESFNKALTKGDSMKFGDNIVSVSAHLASTKFLQFLKETKNDFPLFDCGKDAGEPRYISYTRVCDYVNHCTNRRDETSCLKPLDSPFHICDSGEATLNDVGLCDGIIDCQDESDEKKCYGKCTGKYCTDGSCLQIQWLNDGEVDCNICQDVNDENVIHNKYLERNETCVFICNKGETCVHLSDLHDGSIDCIGPQGPLDETIGKLEPTNTCYNLLGDVIWAPKCVYIKDRYGAVLGCRDMSHLQDCLDYECVEGYVKCHKSYCIPQHYVLDGQADCPTGEEENEYNTGSCSGNFACWDSKVCLYPDLVCDGYPDCPYKDDELNCEVSCPDGFRCVSGTVTVSDYNASFNFENIYHVYQSSWYLDMSGLDLFKLFESYPYFIELDRVIEIKLSSCNISDNIIDILFDYYSKHVLQTLDISYNLIQNFPTTDALIHHLSNIRHLNLSYNNNLVSVKNLEFSFLEIIDLSHTGLSYLDDSLFEELPNLRHLNLSYSFIIDFNKHSFPSHFTLQTLDLRGIVIENFYEDLFGGLTIDQHLYTDKFEICCPQILGTQIPYHTCQALKDPISSCYDLVGVKVQSVLLWVVAVLAVLGNVMIIAYHVIWTRSILKTGYGLFIINIGISDLITGVYLFIIAGANYYYRDNYVLYHKNWRKSVVCKVAGVLSTLSSETSKLFSLLITLDRFLVIKFPFGQIRFSKVSTRIATLLSWCLGFTLSLIPAVSMFEIYSSNAMCLGLPLANQQLKGWDYSIGVFIVFNFFMFLVVTYGQIAIFCAMSDNRITTTATPTSSPRRVEDILVAKQLSLVVLFNFLCWFPAGTMGLLSVGGNEINSDAYAWIMVFILHINAAFNPLLYTIPALMVAWKKFRYGERMRR